MIVPHQLNLTKAQIAKIKKGLPFQIKFDNMGSDKGDVVIGLKEPNAKKLMSAFKKGSGVRMLMDEDEMDYSMKEGQGFLSGIKKGVKKGLSSASKTIEKTANQIAKPVKGAVKKYIPEKDRMFLKAEAQKLIDTSAESLGSMIAEATEDEQLGENIKNAISQTGDNLLSGKKLMIGQKITPIMKKAIKLSIDKIEDPQYKMIANSIVKEAGKGLYGKAGAGLTGKGLSGMGVHMGEGLSGMGVHTGKGMCGGGAPLGGLGKIMAKETKKKTGRFVKGSQEAKDYMSSIRAGKGIFDKVGKAFKKGATNTKTTLFGKRMADEMEFILPAVGGVIGGVGGTYMGGPVGSMAGSTAGSAGGKFLASDMKKRGFGVRSKSAPSGRKGMLIKPASDLMTMSPYQVLTSPAFSPFYPTSSFQNGGSGENK
jgi:hypothetical protein